MDAYLTDAGYKDFKILESITNGEYKDTVFQYMCIIDDLNKLPLFIDSIVDANGENIIDKIKARSDNIIDEKSKAYFDKFIPNHNIIKSYYIQEKELFETKAPYTVTAYNFVLQHVDYENFILKYQT